MLELYTNLKKRADNLISIIMKKIYILIAFQLFIKSFCQSPIYNADATLKFFNYTTNGENRIDYSGNQIINLKVTAAMSTFNFAGISSSSSPVNIELYAKKTNENPILIANQNNVPVNVTPIFNSASKDFFISFNKNNYPIGSVLYCIVYRPGAQYSFQSKNYIFTDCIQTPAPTNISATPYSYGYTIGFSPSGYYSMEYVDLDNNSSGSTTIYTSSTPGQGNFFYYLSQNRKFKFRLKSYSSACALFSNWYTVDPANFICSILPTNLILTSQCVPSPPSYGCGAYVRWDNISTAVGYEFEYLIYNLAGLSKSGVSACSGNSFTFNDSVTSLGAGPWYVKFRVKSKCINNIWSGFSPWSATYIW
jgi:hypothetical protein